MRAHLWPPALPQGNLYVGRPTLPRFLASGKAVLVWTSVQVCKLKDFGQ